MAQFSLVETITKDNLVHQGIVSIPPRCRKSIVWVHGLTGKFYGDTVLMNRFADACAARGWGFASFNTRGHDMVTGVRTADPAKPGKYGHVTIGAGYEVFEDCVHDIDAMVSFLAGQGSDEIVIAGHSTGANKVCFYQATVKDPRVTGVVLSGPISDRMGTYASDYQSRLESAKKLDLHGQGNLIQEGLHFFPLTPKRYLSLFASGSKEDVFTYGDRINTLSVFAQIRSPLFVIFSGKDEYAHRPIKEIRQIFDQHTTSTQYTSMIIEGADHGYTGKEQELVDAVTGWSDQLSHI